jgi:gluconokinase
MVTVLMGPAGAGKSTVAEALAVRLGWRWIDADDYHTAVNVAKMRRGQPLTEADRSGWLQALRGLIERAIERREPLIMACSALRASHRERLSSGLRPVRFVYLKVPREVLRARLEQRRGHYALADLLDSQLATLEEPGEPAITLDGAADVDTIVGHIRLELGV